jgi:L-2,4-diaminobutyric acid acetyltransferase
MNAIIRNISDSDIEKVQSLIKRNGPYVYSYNIYVYWILSKYYNSTTIVAEYNNNIIGIITGLQSIDKNTIFIWQLCVDEVYRRQNIAIKLINSLFESSKRMGIKAIELTITEENHKSLALFKKFTYLNKLQLDENGLEVIGDIREKLYRIKI